MFDHALKLSTHRLGEVGLHVEMQQCKHKQQMTDCIFPDFFLSTRELSDHAIIYQNVYLLNRSHCEVYSIQHYVIKFVSDLLQIGVFLRIIRTNFAVKWILFLKENNNFKIFSYRVQFMLYRYGSHIEFLLDTKESPYLRIGT